MSVARHFRSAAFAAMAMPLLLGACRSGPEPVSEAAREQVVRVGSAAATDLVAALQPRLQAAMAEGGAVYAIPFCADTAQELTAAVSDALGAGVEVKRTSSRYRNPANAPDQEEAAALRYFEQEMSEKGRLPQDYVQRTADGGYRYYRPIVVQSTCVTCHGPVDQIPEDVKQVLAERYPEDRATGYEEGDFRGLIRVSVPADRVPSG